MAYSLPNTDPVHKVSIIPRGLAALGYTLQRPEGDRYLLTQGELESRIQVLLAGTAAEEMVFDDVSTGAQNDLERASAIARSMVMDYGMSRMGRVNYRESSRSPFLSGSGEMTREHSHSEQTAREIDQEVKRIIDESIEKVRHILETRLASLRALSNRLIEKEVIDSDELKQIIEENSSSPLIVPGTAAERKRVAADASEPRAEGRSGRKRMRRRAAQPHEISRGTQPVGLTASGHWRLVGFNDRRTEQPASLKLPGIRLILSSRNGSETADLVRGWGPTDRSVPVVEPPQRLVDHAGDLLPADRLGQHAERFGQLGLLDQEFIQTGREQDARERRLELLDAADRFQARQPRHVHVQQQQMHFLVAHDLQRFLAIAGQQRAKTARLEHDSQRFAKIVIVVGNQDRRGFDRHHKTYPAADRHVPGRGPDDGSANSHIK